MKSIAVIGCGFVGGSLTTVFSERDFVVYTPLKQGIKETVAYFKQTYPKLYGIQ